MEAVRVKEIALDQAVRLRDTQTTPEKIVAAAELFYEFLNGDQKK